MAEPYKTWARNALLDRLRYSRMLYTCLFEASQDGQTCFDPLMFHYPQIDDVFDPNQTEHSFIFGNAIKVSPVLESIPKSIFYPTLRTYFPFGYWVSLDDYS